MAEVHANPGLAISAVCLESFTYDNCQSRIRANGFQGEEENVIKPFV